MQASPLLSSGTFFRCKPCIHIMLLFFFGRKRFEHIIPGLPGGRGEWDSSGEALHGGPWRLAPWRLSLLSIYPVILLFSRRNGKILKELKRCEHEWFIPSQKRKDIKRMQPKICRKYAKKHLVHDRIRCQRLLMPGRQGGGRVPADGTGRWYRQIVPADCTGRLS